MPAFPAAVTHDGQPYDLGTFASEAEAAAAELIALAELRHTDPELPAPLSDLPITRITELVRERLEALTLSRVRQAARLRNDNTRGLRGVSTTSKPWRAEIAAGRRRYPDEARLNSVVMDDDGQVWLHVTMTKTVEVKFSELGIPAGEVEELKDRLLALRKSRTPARTKKQAKAAR